MYNISAWCEQEKDIANQRCIVEKRPLKLQGVGHIIAHMEMKPKLFSFVFTIALHMSQRVTLSNC